MRVLVLSADVGEGHLAAARAIAADLRELDADVVVEDGLRSLGWMAMRIIRDGYRFQLRWAPWSYAAMYRLGARSPAARAIGAVALSLSGRRRLRRLIARHDPDVVVSTHPALTSVLGRMRLRRRLAVPLCATITDLADYAFWSHPGADLHLVMHEHGIAPVEAVAGRGSAVVVRPLVGRGFRDDPDPGPAREALGLPAQGPVVTVSGGGWGVGDLGGAADEALAAGAVAVIVVAGRNDAAHERLLERFAGEPRVRVLGFTERMPELLRASDVLVHSTGGVTSLEALSCGCPLIAYGTTVGHIAIHNRTMAALGLIGVADTRPQLRAQLERRLAGPHAAAPAPAPPQLGYADAAGLVAALRARVRPMPGWRIGVERGTTSLACVAALFIGLSIDDAYSVAARPLELTPTTHVRVASPDVALVVRTPPSQASGVARALARRGVTASFALQRPPSAALARGLARAGDDVLPELGGGGRTHWLGTRGALRSAPRLGSDRRYLVPAHGLALGQYLLARSVDASPVAGQLLLDASSLGTSAPPSSPGDVVVVTAASAAPGASAAGVLRVVARLRSEGLGVRPLSRLLSPAPATAPSAGDDIRSTAPATTTARPATIPAAPSGA